MFEAVGGGTALEYEYFRMVTLTLLIYMPWISEISEAISAPSAIGDRRERVALGADAERGKERLPADTGPLWFL